MLFIERSPEDKYVAVSALIGGLCGGSLLSLRAVLGEISPDVCGLGLAGVRQPGSNAGAVSWLVAVVLKLGADWTRTKSNTRRLISASKRGAGCPLILACHIRCVAVDPFPALPF